MDRPLSVDRFRDISLLTVTRAKRFRVPPCLSGAGLRYNSPSAFRFVLDDAIPRGDWSFSGLESFP